MPDSNAFDFNSTERIPAIGSGNDSAASTPHVPRAHENEEGARPGTEQAPAPVTDSHGRILNPRSCVTCRRRKVKCDKTHPCANCARAHIDCIFPGPGRAPRKPRKHVESRDSELLARLRRLEGVVKTLGVEVPLGDFVSKGHTERRTNSSAHPSTEQGEHAQTVATRKSIDHSTPSSTDSLDGRHTPTHGNLENKFGRLVVTDGRSRYVNTSFWASLNSEVEDLKGILDDDTDVEDGESPGTSQGHHQGNHHGWMFQYNSTAVDMQSLHPPPNQIAVYWNVFRDRVDPLVKVLHLPSITPTILASSSHLGNLSKGFEALLFAIYYSATTSLSPKECRAMLGEDRDALLDKYRFGVEQALARACFLTAAEMVIIQAFVLFLMCLRRNSSARIIWTLTGLLVRMSQTMGIHRDGTHFNLPPFEIEMRRRLWWQICLLDARASEDHGCDPTIVEQSFDTKMPLNVNDTDIAPGMPEFPKEHLGCTDMSFCLIRFEVANTFRRLNYVPPGPKNPQDDYSAATLQQKEQWIQEMHDTLEEKYLKHCDMGVPLYWVTATVSRLIMSKLWLVVYHPLQRSDASNNLSDDIRNKLFIISLENIEYGILLQTETRTMKWGWLFRTYMQWHALALLLTELCKRTRGPLVERAWLAVGQVHEYLRELNSNGGAVILWKPIDRLMAKAKIARQKALDEDAANQSFNNEAAPDNNLVAGSVAHLLQNMRQDQRPNSAASSIEQNRPTPVYGSLARDSIKILSSTDLTRTENSPVTSTQRPAFKPDSQVPSAFPPRVESPTSYLNNDTATATTMPSQSATMTGMQDWNTMSTGHRGTMDSTMSFGADNPNNFTMANFAAANNNTDNNDNYDLSQMGDMFMTFDANGDLDWANWDTMVRQFGMDVDSGEVAPNVPVQGAWNGPGWNGMMGGPTQGGMPMGQTDWF